MVQQQRNAVMHRMHVISIEESYLKITVYQLLEILGDKIDLSALTIQQLTTDSVIKKIL